MSVPEKTKSPLDPPIPSVEMQELLMQKHQAEIKAGKQKRKPSDENDSDWLITYADAVTILLAFFVLIFSVSEIRQSKFEDLNQSLGQTLLKKETVKNPLKDLQSSLSGVLNAYDISPIDSITVSDNTLKLDLPGELLFGTGSTDLSETSAGLLTNVAKRIKAFPFKNYSIEIEGHTDDVPISTERFPSNWQLSSGRAISVLQVFFAAGIDKNRLKAIGYADTHPKRPNRDQYGEPIPENQAQNRRVEIVVSKILN
ncbi:OmpA family protein [Thiomicrorhabdus sp. ZW0627]|uniref:OmpA/MotB family protein n=1 Tax=Thiomicrorhabdus sp. ZW0627 TaxID=3039774 RepID=UPI0024366A13|nr:OmpA family protein [Thiomicrorhabdus sp. ZW0627]MDG6774381.1 OmpA family protein [Thiomicrorhabdus sp. ZW0627]